MSEPRPDRPEMPEGYGVEQAEEFVSWETIEAKLRDSHHYWMSTTRRDGRPHVVPRWGVWLDGRFWYDGSPETLHVRNLERDPRCVLHLESGEQATIIEGESLRADPIQGELGDRLAAEFARKYAPEYAPEPSAWADEPAGGMRTLTPVKALAWTRFPKDVTRYIF